MVSTRLAEGKIPNGAQLAQFLRALVNDAIPVCQRTNPGFVQNFKQGFASIGWDATSNKAATNAPPAASQGLAFLEKAVTKLQPVGHRPSGNIIDIMSTKIDFVESRLAQGKIPNGSQLADFMRKLVSECWPLAQQNQNFQACFQSGVASGIGWNLVLNKPASPKPPTPQAVLNSLRATLAQMENKPAPAVRASLSALIPARPAPISFQNRRRSCACSAE